MKNKKGSQGRIHSRIAIAGMSALLLMISTSFAFVQNRTPYDKERLLKVVRLNALSTQEVVQAIEQRGVDFEVNGGIENEFRSAGARPELIDAMRRNYRPASPPPSSGTGRRLTPPPNTNNVPAGPPLSKNEIVTMLQGGLPATRVEQFVEVRGVSFAMNPTIAREITAAGGNRSLIGAITERASTDSSIANAPRTSGPATAAAPDYDDLTDQAVTAMQANDANRAIQSLQRAVAMDSRRPTAYQLLGFAELYGRKDVFSAERSMRAAIERGGSATFYVYHDHDGFFNTFCEGSFFVNKGAVSYKAKDGNHTFDAQDALIKETDLNGFIGAQYGAFHLKVREGDRDKSKTYNFAPLTRNKAESKLIISMIKGYQ